MPLMNAEKFRAFHRRRGERYRWLKAVRHHDDTRGAGPEGGWHYIEQTINSAWRALVHTTTRAIDSTEFGLIEAGATEFSVMPDEAYVGRMDKIILVDRKQRGDALLERGGGATDTLPNSPVSSVVSVRQGLVVFRADTDYEYADDELTWNPIYRPVDGATYLYGPGATITRGAGATDDVSAVTGITHVYGVIGTTITEYVLTTDYTLLDGVITWTGTAPVAAATYIVAALTSITRAEAEDLNEDADTPAGLPAVTASTVVRDVAGIGAKAYRKDTDWEVDSSAIRWFPAPPAEGEKYSVEYRYAPTFTCLGVSPDRLPRPDKDGTMMPLRVLLTLDAIGDE